jgi:cytochrome P450
MMLGRHTIAHNRQNAYKHGDCYHWHLGVLKKDPNVNMIAQNLLTGEVWVTLLKADAIRDFSVNQDKYVKSKTQMSMFNLIMGEGLLSSDGAKWKRHRKLTTQVMHYEYYQSMIPVILEVARNVFSDIIKENKLENVQIRHVYESITAEMVGRIFFGDSLSKIKIFEGNTPIQELSHLLYHIGTETSSPSYLLFGLWFVKAGILPKYRRLMNRNNTFME